MNRKERRAAEKRAPSSAPHADVAGALFAEAVQQQQLHRFNDAVRLYKRLLALRPDHAQAHNNLGIVLLAQGKHNEASARFAQSLSLMPQLFEQFNGVYQTLEAVLPALANAVRQAVAMWPARATIEQMFDRAGLHAVAADPLLLCTLQSVPVRKIGLELVLTSLRAAFLADLGDPGDVELAFRCALAEQCFINEYVFATTPDEDSRFERLKSELETAAESGTPIAPALIATVAMYQPLHSMPAAARLLERNWPRAVDLLLTQQVREPTQEVELRAGIPAITPIEDATSQRVRDQYEQNPYPRWVSIAGGVTPITLDEQLRRWFPDVAFIPLGKTDTLDVLVAGCGTGLQSAQVAQGYIGARVLAIDLSLASLCYAKRKTKPPLAERVEYAQGDILKLGRLGRRFDMIEATGVLHHMKDPFEGWRILLSLLRPGGFMHLGFYSEMARRDVVAARAFIAERGYAASAADIRRCRQDLMRTPLNTLARTSDFFTTSECRDLLFHVQENRLTLPVIKDFLDSEGLKFIGFNFDDAHTHKFRAQFAAQGWSPTDLDKWHEVESQYPDTFISMYQFWVQKA